MSDLMRYQPLGNLMREWLASADVQRVAHDDDELSPSARMRPLSGLAKVAAELLVGAGGLRPMGDGSYLVRWKDDEFTR